MILFFSSAPSRRQEGVQLIGSCVAIFFPISCRPFAVTQIQDLIAVSPVPHRDMTRHGLYRVFGAALPVSRRFFRIVLDGLIMLILCSPPLEGFSSLKQSNLPWLQLVRTG